MTLKEIYAKAIKVGMENDPRGVAAPKGEMAKAKKELAALPDKEKKWFDEEKLVNPYEDTRIVNGPDDVEVKTVLAGIDIGEGELVLADRLKEKGRRIDAVISHHPLARGLAGLPGVMSIQPGIYASVGVPIAQAEGVLEPRIREVASRVSPANLQRTADAARLLGLPLACFHTVADNCVSNYLDKLFRKEKPATLGDILDLLHEIPEYAEARAAKAAPELVCGSKGSTAGEILIEMTGGTEGAKEMYAKLARSTNISTIVGMHFSKEHVDAARAENLNLVIAGHISSDNLGMNVLFDGIFGSKVEVIECSGFRRMVRKKK